MTRKIYCQKLAVTADGLETPPFPNTLGQRIFEHISQPAWNQWIAHQTMLINEYKLNLIDKTARDFLTTEMKKFLFGE